MLSFSNLQRKYQISPEKQLPDAHLHTAGHVTPSHQTPHVSGFRRADVVKTLLKFANQENRFVLKFVPFLTFI